VGKNRGKKAVISAKKRENRSREFIPEIVGYFPSCEFISEIAVYF
jgi:hypothetical protein